MVTALGYSFFRLSLNFRFSPLTQSSANKGAKMNPKLNIKYYKEVCKAYIYNSEKKSQLGLYDPLHDLIVAMIATDIGKLSIADDIGVDLMVDGIIKEVFAEVNL